MMTFLAVYISSTDGTILKQYIYHEEQALPESIISSGLVERTHQLTKELHRTYTDITITQQQDNLTYSIMKFGDINVVAITDMTSSLESLVHEVGWKFLRMFGDIDFFTLTKDYVFNEFDSVMEKIVNINFGTELKSLDRPQKKLTPVAIFQLPLDIQDIAMSILSMGKGNVKQIADDVDQRPSTVTKGLETLLEMGFVTRMDYEGDTYYQL